MKVDTNRPFTVVTQFPTNRLGELYEIRRLYIQDRKIIYNSPVLIPEGLRTNAMTTPLCDAVGSDAFKRLGGHKEMGEAIGRGMVLAMSIWWDEGGYMRWLDSGEAGPCSETEGAPANIRLVQPDTSVTFSKLKWGEMGSTFSTWPGPPKGKPKPKPRH
jgi:cellulase